jgi:hypothetical protein
VLRVNLEMFQKRDKREKLDHQVDILNKKKEGKLIKKLLQGLRGVDGRPGTDGYPGPKGDAGLPGLVKG